MKKLPAVALVVLPLLLAACGNKGPLVKPSQVPPADEPVSMPMPVLTDTTPVAPAATAADPAATAPVPEAMPEAAPEVVPEVAPPADDSDD